MGANRWLKYTVERIPIPDAPLKDKRLQKPLVERVEKILKAKAKDPAADTSGLEREIDREVFRLYGLTDDEARALLGDGGR